MDEATQVLFERLGISLLLGLLVGLQRQHVAAPTAGLRTFPLITVFGTLSAIIDRQFGSSGWILAASLLGVTAVILVTHASRLRSEEPHLGMTTVAAILLMFSVGAYLAEGARTVAIAIGAGVAVLLQYKPELHGVAARLGDDDMRAIMQFALLTCIVLPVLPNQTYGPFQVLNPFEIWLMVVLIVGISLGGYIAYKFLGRNAGMFLGGVLGGAISSTATTVSYARRSATDPHIDRLAAVVILIASSVVFVRVLVEIAVVAPRFLVQLGLPIFVMFVMGLLATLIAWFGMRRQPSEMPSQSNPSELKSALLFGLIYGVVLFALAAAQHYWGGGGLYAVAAASGMTDMDAITLSTSRLVKNGLAEGGISPSIGWRLLVVASISNLVFKCGMVALLGCRGLLYRVALLFAVPVLTGVGMLLLLP